MEDSILIIEDDDAIRDILVYSFKSENFKVFETSSGFEGIEITGREKISLIILDIMLPDISGFSVCKKISEKHKTPIIMLTAKNDITDKIFGLEIGADDYITKPFDIREVIARVRVILRRMELLKEHEDKNTLKLNSEIKINKDSHEVYKGEKTIVLKPREYELLLMLAENRNMVFSREKLLECVWGFEYEGDSRTVDVHIQRLRKKLGLSKDDSVIKTMFGIGYKMV